MSRRARDAFFKDPSVATATKIDLSLQREKETDKDSEKSFNLSNSSQSSGLSRSLGSSSSEGGYVGYASLPNQIYRKCVKRGFEFNLMVVGESGLGKSTLINSLFLSDLYNADNPGPSARPKKTSRVETTRVLLKEGGVNLKLSIIDTPGFGDAVNNSDCWKPIIDEIDKRYEDYLNEEARVNRKLISDCRVHCCLYFIPPNGHGLRELDMEVMKRLHYKVNVIPVIAKADCFTSQECKDFKKTILKEMINNEIHIYDFPLSNVEDEKGSVKKMKEKIPFAVVGSNTLVESNGKKVRARVYPWGVVEVENMEHNDFSALKNMLIRMHMQDLKEVTDHVHYENFRFHKLASCSHDNRNSKQEMVADERNPMLQIEEEKKMHLEKMRKMEAEMEQVFEMKVKEKIQKLKDSELDLERRREQMNRNLEIQEKELSDKMRRFEMEREAWEEQNKNILEEQFQKNKKRLF